MSTIFQQDSISSENVTIEVSELNLNSDNANAELAIQSMTVDQATANQMTTPNFSTQAMTVNDFTANAMTATEMSMNALTASELKTSKLIADSLTVPDLNTTEVTVHHMSIPTAQLSNIPNATLNSSFVAVQEAVISINETVPQVNIFSGGNSLTGITRGIKTSDLEYMHLKKCALSTLMVDEGGSYWHADELGGVKDQFNQPLKIFLNDVDFRTVDFRNLGLLLGYESETIVTANSATSDNFTCTQSSTNGLEIKGTGASEGPFSWHWSRVLKILNVGGIVKDSSTFEFVASQHLTVAPEIVSNYNDISWYMFGAGIREANETWLLDPTLGKDARASHAFLMGCPFFNKTTSHKITNLYGNGFPNDMHWDISFPEPVNFKNDSWFKFRLQTHSDSISASIVQVNPDGANIYDNEIGPVQTWTKDIKTVTLSYCLAFSFFNILPSDTFRVLAARTY